ncbi:TetR/AcrR family transcriptional regulator [Pseudonocardia humida]|uniref:TetR/AcrR family transcriptional regulator n=1 Tax=Pseudonocardia humida TaxID=2800819 RepID=A0ABT0ZUH6_9PSEU|nr:TetR/AcrR family transcriptional regulator [Pseudonocardia humida]MCO1654387.1 TetR/AcrR family transcriptional regulator [Pseudonocardia humida]
MVGGVESGRREQLVLAAFRRVAEAGFEGLRLRQVAEDVGIDHSTLHHHFATKQDLVLAVAEYATRQFWVLGDGPPDPARALREHLAGLRRMLDERPELFVVTVELDLRARRDPAVDDALRRHEAGWREVLSDVLTAGNAAGAWAAPLDVAVTTELVIATAKGVRLAPAAAGPVFAQLEAMVIGDRGEQP